MFLFNTIGILFVGFVWNKGESESELHSLSRGELRSEKYSSSVERYTILIFVALQMVKEIFFRCK